MIYFTRCDGCDKELPLGVTKYRIQINIASDFDGVLPEYDEPLDQKIEGALKEASMLTEEEAEAQVHQELILILCKSCRDRLLDDLSPYAEGSVETRVKIPVRIQ